MSENDLRLPLDVLSEVLPYLSTGSLRNLAVTSKIMADITRRSLFADVHLNKGWDQVEQLASALRARPDSSSLIHSLAIQTRCLWGQNNPLKPSESEQQELIYILSRTFPTLHSLCVGPAVRHPHLGQTLWMPFCPATLAIFDTIYGAPLLKHVTLRSLKLPLERPDLTWILKRKSVQFLHVGGGPFTFRYDDIPLTEHKLETLTLNQTCGYLYRTLYGIFDDQSLQRSYKLDSLTVIQPYMPWPCLPSIRKLVKDFSWSQIAMSPLDSTESLDILLFEALQHCSIQIEHSDRDCDLWVPWIRDFIASTGTLANHTAHSPLKTFRMEIGESLQAFDSMAFNICFQLGRLLDDIFMSGRFPQLERVTLLLNCDIEGSINDLGRKDLVEMVNKGALLLYSTQKLCAVVNK